MKLMTKIIIAISTLLITMLVTPLLIVNLAPADMGMGLIFMLFFAIDPFAIIILSIMAGTDLRRLWWIPIVGALCLPLGYSVVIQEFVVELFVYSALYIGAGLIAMFGTHFGIKVVNKRKMTNQEKNNG